MLSVMKTTTYKKHTEVFLELEDLIREKIRRNEWLLPPELELTGLLGASRMTIRKALCTAEEKGLIARKNYKTTILDRSFNLRNCGRILFLATGQHGIIHHFAVERLYFRLDARVKALSGNMGILLLPSYLASDGIQEEESLIHALDQADIILFTTSDAGIFRNNPNWANIAERHLKGKIRIKVTEDAYSLADNYIMLDNRLAGIKAARILAKAGARKIFLPSPDTSCPSFDMRAAGLRTEAASLSIPVSEGPRRFCPVSEVSAQLDEAVENGADAFFFVSDENIDAKTEGLFSRGLVPDRVKLITVNGAGLAIRHVPPIPSLSNGTGAIVNGLVNTFGQIAEGSFGGTVRILAEPNAYFLNEIKLNSEEIF